MIKHRIAAYSYLQPMERLDSAPVHDALAVCYLIQPDVLEQVKLVRCDVDISGGLADGQTIVDPRAYTDLPKNVHFAFFANRDKFSDLLFSILRGEN
jgi:inosine-uridine nucleoside N-ribohydrolase